MVPLHTGKKLAFRDFVRAMSKVAEQTFGGGDYDFDRREGAVRAARAVRPCGCVRAWRCVTVRAGVRVVVRTGAW